MTGAAGTILPRVSNYLEPDAPSNKLNIALMGTWGRAEAHFDAISHENVVAICDINEDHLAFGRGPEIPQAKQYVDWRAAHRTKGHRRGGLLHAGPYARFIANWAMNRGKHVYWKSRWPTAWRKPG